MLNGDMYGCNSGVSYEDAVVAFLNEHGFQAYKTGKSDGGIDIVAVSITKPQSYTFNIQCKYYNKPLGKAPIQEVYSGTQYYGTSRHRHYKVFIIRGHNAKGNCHRHG